MQYQRTIIGILSRYLCHSVADLVSNTDHLLIGQTLQQSFSYEILLVVTKAEEQLL